MIQYPKTAGFTRPADTNAYTQFDVVSNSTSAGAALQFTGGTPGSTVKITRVLVQHSTTTVTATDMGLALFARDPGVVNDNGAFSAFAFSAADPYGYLGTINLAIFATKAGHNGSVSDNVLTTPLSIVHGAASSGTIYGVLLAANATPFTPASGESFRVTLFEQPQDPTVTVAKSATFVRPNDTTAYAANDVISNATSGGAALKFPVKGQLNRVIVTKSSNTTANSAFLLYLFSQDPGALSDNAAFAHGVDPNLLGIVSIAAASVQFVGGGQTGLASTALGYAVSDNIISAPISISGRDAQVPGQVGGGGGAVYGVLVATAAYAPAALEQFSVQLHVAPDAN